MSLTYIYFLQAWKLYGTGKLGEAVEPSLQGNFIIEEASRLLQIGLLCVQASAELRPSMSVVVKMLNNQHEIAQPTQPPFLNCSSSDISPLNRSGTPYFQSDSYKQSSGNDMTDSLIEARWRKMEPEFFFWVATKLHRKCSILYSSTGNLIRRISLVL